MTAVYSRPDETSARRRAQTKTRRFNTAAAYARAFTSYAYPRGTCGPGLTSAGGRGPGHRRRRGPGVGGSGDPVNRWQKVPQGNYTGPARSRILYRAFRRRVDCSTRLRTAGVHRKRYRPRVPGRDVTFSPPGCRRVRRRRRRHRQPGGGARRFTSSNIEYCESRVALCSYDLGFSLS